MENADLIKFLNQSIGKLAHAIGLRNGRELLTVQFKQNKEELAPVPGNSGPSWDPKKW
jgi:hypothetical protein